MSNRDKSIGNIVSFAKQQEVLRLVKLYYEHDAIAARVGLELNQVRIIARNGEPIEPTRSSSVHRMSARQHCPNCGVEVVMPCLKCDLDERRRYAKRLGVTV